MEENNVQPNINNYQPNDEKPDMNSYQTNQMNYQNNVNTNDKNATFGISQDGRIIASARKIKEELIKMYLIIEIPREFILTNIQKILFVPIALELGINFNPLNLETIIQKMILVLLTISFLSVITSVLIVFLSSKITFKKYKIKKMDINNVIKVTIIYFCIITSILVFKGIKNYNSIQKIVNKMDLTTEIYNAYDENNELPNEYEIVKSSMESIKYYYSRYCICSIIIDIATAGGCIILQKKLLIKNAED